MSTNRDIIDAMMYSDASRGAPRPESTITTTTTDPGVMYWDRSAFKIVGGNSPPVERYEASLRVRGHDYGFAYTEIKPSWYAKLFARLLGLEWYEEMVTTHDQFISGMPLAWTPCGDGAVGT